MSEKTEEPTPKRLLRARDEGDSGASPGLTQGVSFLVVGLAVSLLMGQVATDLSLILRTSIGRVGQGMGGGVDATSLVLVLLRGSIPAGLLVALSVTATTMLQTGGAISTKKLGFDGSRIDPISGLKGLLSVDRLWKVVSSLLAAVAILWLAWRNILGALGEISHLPGKPHALVAVYAELAGALFRDGAAVLLCLGLVDGWVSHRSFLKRNRMTKEEVKREYRDAEGDPQIRQQRERVREEMAAQMSLFELSKATVLIVNPTHIACALRYDTDEGDSSPVVLSLGRGEHALRMIERAHALGIPVVQDIPLAHALEVLEAGDTIPEELYEAVAAVLSTLWAKREET